MPNPLHLLQGLLNDLQGLVEPRVLHALPRAFVALVVGLLLSRLVSRRLTLRGFHAQQTMLLRRLINSGILLVSVAWALKELGFELGPLLGAAGLVTVAVGFAAQTSVSNLISGLFLIGERSFVVGDVIKVGEVVGEVLSIDSMSVKLRTFDNLMVRIPNEGMLKSNITNYTLFPIRRVDVVVSVAYREDLSRVRAVLEKVADDEPLALREPPPQILTQGFGESAVNIQVSVWGTREDYLKLKNRLFEAIKGAFDAEGIEIPYPHRSLHPHPGAPPLTIRLVKDEAPSGEEPGG